MHAVANEIIIVCKCCMCMCTIYDNERATPTSRRLELSFNCLRAIASRFHAMDASPACVGDRTSNANRNGCARGTHCGTLLSRDD